MELLRPSFEICHLIDESEVGRNCRLAYAVAEPMCFAPVAHPYTRARNRTTEILARTCSPNVASPRNVEKSRFDSYTFVPFIGKALFS